MLKIKALDRQTIFDISIQEYGSVEGVFQLLQDNPIAIPSLDAYITPGATVIIGAPPINKRIQEKYAAEKRQPVSVTNDELQLFGEFDEEFNNEFA